MARPGRGGLARGLPQDVILELYNEAGQLAIAYKIYRCWSPSSSPAGPRRERERGRDRQDQARERRLERDYDVVEPKEPAFTEPSP